MTKEDDGQDDVAMEERFENKMNLAKAFIDGLALEIELQNQLRYDKINGNVTRCFD